jgi:hypothetical protein
MYFSVILSERSTGSDFSAPRGKGSRSALILAAVLHLAGSFARLASFRSVHYAQDGKQISNRRN